MNLQFAAARLERWRKAGDDRLWKLIVSPEFGESSRPETDRLQHARFETPTLGVA
jgi:hypothetical protein